MSEQMKEGALQIGLLSVDRRKLLSPQEDRPGLFVEPHHDVTNAGIEREARAALARQGIVTSSQHMLHSTPDGVHRGYLLRESTKVDLEEHALTLFTTGDLLQYIRTEDPHDVSGHFLRQIVRYMN